MYSWNLYILLIEFCFFFFSSRILLYQYWSLCHLWFRCTKDSSIVCVCVGFLCAFPCQFHSVPSIFEIFVCIATTHTHFQWWYWENALSWRSLRFVHLKKGILLVRNCLLHLQQQQWSQWNWEKRIACFILFAISNNMRFLWLEPFNISKSTNMRILDRCMCIVYAWIHTHTHIYSFFFTLPLFVCLFNICLTI